jgi:Ca2+-binding EF-hand superfamily protein
MAKYILALLSVFTFACSNNNQSCSDFDVYDIDKNLVLTKDEFIQIDKFTTFDISKDSKIDRKEFCNGLSNKF